MRLASGNALKISTCSILTALVTTVALSTAALSLGGCKKKETSPSTSKTVVDPYKSTRPYPQASA